jgi:hypothetical protein
LNFNETVSAVSSLPQKFRFLAQRPLPRDSVRVCVRLLRREAESGPFRRHVGEASDAHAMRGPAIDGGCSKLATDNRLVGSSSPPSPPVSPQNTHYLRLAEFFLFSQDPRKLPTRQRFVDLLLSYFQIPSSAVNCCMTSKNFSLCPLASFNLSLRRLHFACCGQVLQQPSRYPLGVKWPYLSHFFAVRRFHFHDTVFSAERTAAKFNCNLLPHGQGLVCHGHRST